MYRSAAENLGNGPAVSPLERALERAAAELIAARTLNREDFSKPFLSAQCIDEARGVGVFILSEQIDNDGGWCGQQFRYSVWLVRRDGESQQIYSDHAYHRPELRGRSSQEGRDPRVDLIEMRDGAVVVRGTGNEGTALGGVKTFLVGFDGHVRELEAFADQARNHIEQVGAKLGYDRVSAFVEIPGEEIAAVTFTSENGRDYGYDTVYLVWRDTVGEIRARTLVRTPEYSAIRHCALSDGSVGVVVATQKEETFTIPLGDIGR